MSDECVEILTMPQMAFLVFFFFSFFFILGPQLRPLLHIVFLLVPIRNTTPLGSEPIALRHALLKSLSLLIQAPEYTLLLNS